MVEVSFKNVKKYYGPTRAVNGVTFDIADGEFVALVGPSGCGKSTLLRMVAGLEDICGGTISIAYQIVNDVEPKLRDVAMVFQNYALYPHMTIRENLGFSLKLRRASRSEINVRVDEASRILGLNDHLDQFPQQLSGGQRQRVAMGRAMVRRPAVFLFDEPLSNLDAVLRSQMRAEIRDLHDRLQSTSIFVTHDQAEAMTMADRIVVLRSGRLEQVGAPLDVYDRPANTFVAKFIGSPAMNLLSGEVQNGSIKLSPNITVPVPFNDNGSVIWGIRPEHLYLAPAETPGAFGVRVAAIENTGQATVVMGDIDGNSITALIGGRTSLVKGDLVHFRAQPDKQHFFNATTEARIG